MWLSFKNSFRTHPILSNCPGAQRGSPPLCSFPPSSPGEPGRCCFDLTVCGTDSSVRMGTEAILLCGCFLGLPLAAQISLIVAAPIRRAATGGICMCFLTSKFLEVQMASLMAARVSHCFSKSFLCAFVPWLTP